MPNASIFELMKARLEKLSARQLDEVDRLISKLALSNGEPLVQEFSMSLDWPHAPLHRIGARGVYMVTAGTKDKQHYFKEPQSLDMFQSNLLCLAKRWMWQLEAWACFSNHYHFIARADEAACELNVFIQQLHSHTASELNARDNTKERAVWYNFFETELTYPNSYFARLNYVHQNAVRHGIVPVANQYKWCSAAWFEQTATPSQVKTIYSFKTDRLRVPDDYEVF